MGTIRVILLLEPIMHFVVCIEREGFREKLEDGFSRYLCDAMQDWLYILVLYNKSLDVWFVGKTMS